MDNPKDKDNKEKQDQLKLIKSKYIPWMQIEKIILKSSDEKPKNIHLESVIDHKLTVLLINLNKFENKINFINNTIEYEGEDRFGNKKINQACTNNNKILIDFVNKGN